ncbi:NYN domain-containing protein [Methanolobus psychrotolerans]|uniref:NYN domain-containing protein n=1 Tax=Methanolobus psychrotolerans TaxID=1874706 RepID=UPI000B918FC5|nr:NYN domain-containing protein [Methanolobus psychrotolerans]
MEENGTQNKLAVLIDADNAQPSIIEGLLDEIAIYGIASVKRIYGDWTKPNLNSWKDALLEHSIQPMQQFAYTTGKNATDSSLIIDAMDLLYTEKFDGFCIVSSDSDFTRLSQRIRESGLKVYGFGEKKTPQPFISACDKFIYTEILRKQETGTENISTLSKTEKWNANELKGDTRLVNHLRNAVEDSADEDGWAFLAEVGGNLIKRNPAFDPRTYGFTKLGELVEATNLFEIDKRAQNGAGKSVVVYIRDKRGKGKK